MRIASRSSNSRYTPRTNKTPGKTSAGQAVRRLALMGRAVSEGLRPLHFYNSLRSVVYPSANCLLSGAAACLLQSFITSCAGSVSHKSLPSARYRLKPMSLIIARFLLSRLESLCESFKSSKGGQSWPLRVQWRDSVFLFVPDSDSPDALISVVAFVVLCDCCARGGKTLISRQKGCILIISMQRDVSYGYRLQMLLLCR